MGKKLGRAHAMTGQVWWDWLLHLRDTVGAQTFLAIYLTSAACLRISQVLQLRSEDVQLKGKACVNLLPFKRHGRCKKPLLPTVVKSLQSFKKRSIPSASKKAYAWPKTGWLFPSTNPKAARPHWTKDTLCRQISKARKSFVQKFSDKWPELQNGKSIRTHSGRRRAITTFAATDLPPQVGMAYAQIDSFRVYKQYIDLSPLDVCASMQGFDSKTRVGAVPRDFWR